jgi:hypothetical protein
MIRVIGPVYAKKMVKAFGERSASCKNRHRRAGQDQSQQNRSSGGATPAGFKAMDRLIDLGVPNDRLHVHLVYPDPRLRQSSISEAISLCG